MTTLNELRRHQHFALLLVEHRLRQIQPFINRVLVMREGSSLPPPAIAAVCLIPTGWLITTASSALHEQPQRQQR